MKDIRNTESQDAPEGAKPVDHTGSAEAKRVAARRRFLRMGAGGSAAVLVTVVHKRAFAGGGVKKGSVVSHCVSIGGTPDIKGMDQKKALQISAGGTLKNTVCYTSPKNVAPANTCGSPLGGTTPVYGLVLSVKSGKYKVQVVDNVPIFSDKQMKNGCGSLEGMLNSPYQQNYRLYKKFACPVQIVGGNIQYFPPSTTVYDDKGKLRTPCVDP